MTIENATMVVQSEANIVGDIVVPLIVAGIIATISFFIFLYQRRMASHAAVAEAFRMLNDVKHREARKVLYDVDEKKPPRKASYDIIGVKSDEPSNQEALVEICKDIARNDFNEIGTLAHYKLLDGKIFVNENFWIILKVWSLAEKDIMDRRDRHSFNYMKRLEDLKDRACDYVAAHEQYYHVYEEFCSGKATSTKNATTEDTTSKTPVKT